MRYFTARDLEVHLVSLYPGAPTLPLASFHYLPVAFSSAVPQARVGKAGAASSRWLNRVITPGIRTALRQRFVPLSLPRAARRLEALLVDIQPTLVHALRIPYEGMLAALANPSMPLLISVWGNDFTLHATANPAMANLTRLTMARANALHTDCHNDRQLAGQWGFSDRGPAIVLPGGGGVPLDVFYPPAEPKITGPYTVINPRGLRAYVRNDTFFQAIPHILATHPDTRFLCPAMAGAPHPERSIARLGLTDQVALLPRQTSQAMADLFRQSQVVASITTHDGTPNTLLEALACGCFPVAGDIPSLREWITPGKNGHLVDPIDPLALADAIIKALNDPNLRAQAAEHNNALVQQRAERQAVMTQAEVFYQKLWR
jgi:hypothetical protein